MYPNFSLYRICIWQIHVYKNVSQRFVYNDLDVCCMCLDYVL